MYFSLSQIPRRNRLTLYICQTPYGSGHRPWTTARSRSISLLLASVCFQGNCCLKIVSGNLMGRKESLLIDLARKRLHHERTTVLLSTFGADATGRFPLGGEGTWSCQGDSVVLIYNHRPTCLWANSLVAISTCCDAKSSPSYIMYHLPGLKSQ